MPTHELRWMFMDAAFKATAEKPKDREPPVRGPIGSFGENLTDRCFMFGEYDGIAIIESRATRQRRRPAYGPV